MVSILTAWPRSSPLREKANADLTALAGREGSRVRGRVVVIHVDTEKLNIEQWNVQYFSV
jgi:hypothetical protein